MPQNTASIYPGLHYINSALQPLQTNHISTITDIYGNNNSKTVYSQTQYVQRQAMNYPTIVVPPSDPVAAHQFILSGINYSTNSGNAETCHRHVLELMNELHEEDNNKGHSAEKYVSIESYKKAFQRINDMLFGKQKLSYADASYYSEAAYGDAYMSYNEFKENIEQSANFIKKWMQQNKIPLAPENIHYAIQQFMGDTMSIATALDAKTGREMVTHFPFKYDYQDYEGKADYRNYFSTKCLATGTGQCNSMPMVYLQLCEALGVKGYLTFAPFHSFVKYKDTRGQISNYEPTSHWTITDKWYQDYLGINTKAKKSGIYLDTINRQQAVANTLVDLAISYIFLSNNPDTVFVMQCLNTAQKFFPKRNNVYVYLAKSNLLSRELDQALKKYRIKDLSEVKNYPDTNKLYNALIQNENYLMSLGYEEMPQSIYEELIQNQKNKTNAPDAKIKKTLFKKNN